jgi:hypothetical protein
MSPSSVAPGTLERIRAVLGHRGIYELGATITWDKTVGRPSQHPPYVLLAFATLARLTRSIIRVEVDLAEPVLWEFTRTQMITALDRHGLDLPPPGPKPPRWHHWNWLRNQYLATDEGLAHLSRAFPAVAVAAARDIGLLHPHGPGSFTHPHRSRCVYGDQTSIKPLYEPPDAIRTVDPDTGQIVVRYPDPHTGALQDAPPRRFDPDLADFHGMGGGALTHGYVPFHARGDHPYRRVMLALDHTPAPGMEADTALGLVGSLHREAGSGIQAVIYDRALHGVHVDTIMTRFGYLALTKMPDAPTGTEVATLAAVRGPDGRKAKSYPLGPVSHNTVTGACVHHLAAIDGAVVVIDLDESGDPVIVAAPTRGAVKRSRRADGRYHFNVGYTLDCPNGAFTVWLSPHPGRAKDTARPNQLRVIPPADPDFNALHGLREDAESTHAQLRRTLLVNRQMSKGWHRGLVDLYCFALYNNALTEHRALRDRQREMEGSTHPSRKRQARSISW